MQPTAKHTQLNRANPVRFLCEPETLLEKEKDLILELYYASGLTDEEWNCMALAAILNLAKYVELLPASAEHHHSEEGGLFRHSLETALASIRLARNSVLSKVGTHAEVNFARLYWNNAALLGGLLHDVGKVVNNFAVFDLATHQRWQPLNESLWEWGKRLGVETYAVISLSANDFKQTEDPFGTDVGKAALAAKELRDDHEIFSRTLAPKLIPEHYKKWFLGCPTEDVQQALYLSLCAHEGDDRDYLRKCICKADSVSTKNYVAKYSDILASESTLSIVTAFLSGVTYAITKGFWKVNTTGGQLFVIENKCFVDWNNVSLNSLSAFLEANNKKSGFIRQKEELAQWLLDNGLCHANKKYSPDGAMRESAFFTIQPGCLTRPTRAIWLNRSPFAGQVPSISGCILDCTDVPPYNPDDLWSGQHSQEQLVKAQDFMAEAQRQRQENENELFEKTRLNKKAVFDEKTKEKVKELRKFRRVQTGLGQGLKFSFVCKIIDSVLGAFGYTRVVDIDPADVREVSDSRVPQEYDFNFAWEKGSRKTINTFSEDVIHQGVSEEFATKKIGYKQSVEEKNPSLNDTLYLLHEGDKWRSYRKFPEIAHSFSTEENKSAAYGDFLPKKTARFAWKFYPFAQKLAALTSKDSFDKLKFSAEEEKTRLWLKDFMEEGLVPSEIFPKPVPQKVFEEIIEQDKEQQKQTLKTKSQGGIAVRTPETEKDVNVIAEFAGFYETALAAFKAGRLSGCFPTEFKNSEFYPFFIELASIFLNEIKVNRADGTGTLSLVEINKKSLRINAWNLFTARFRALNEQALSQEENDPAVVLATRVEKFLKPVIQIHKDSFYKNDDEECEPVPGDFSVTFNDELTVTAVNFLVREHDSQNWRQTFEYEYAKLFFITNPEAAAPARVADLKNGAEVADKTAGKSRRRRGRNNRSQNTSEQNIGVQNPTGQNNGSENLGDKTNPEKVDGEDEGEINQKGNDNDNTGETSNREDKKDLRPIRTNLSSSESSADQKSGIQSTEGENIEQDKPSNQNKSGQQHLELSRKEFLDQLVEDLFDGGGAILKADDISYSKTGTTEQYSFELKVLQQALKRHCLSLTEVLPQLHTTYHFTFNGTRLTQTKNLGENGESGK